MYRIVFAPSFRRDYEKLSLGIQQSVDEQLGRLRENPHHPSLRTHKRKGEKDIWQARITRSYRLYFQMQGEVITVLRVTEHEK